MGHQLGTQVYVDTGGRRQALGHLLGAGGETSAEPVRFRTRIRRQALLALQLLEVGDRQFQNIRLFQLGDVLAVGGQCRNHQLLQLVQAAVDPGPPFSLEHRLHDFPVLHGAGYRLGLVVARRDGVRRHLRL